MTNTVTQKCQCWLGNVGTLTDFVSPGRIHASHYYKLIEDRTEWDFNHYT